MRKFLIVTCRCVFVLTAIADVSDSLKGAHAYASGDYETAICSPEA